MANRDTLAVSKLEDFKQWLIKDGWEIQETKGCWEVLRATKQDEACRYSNYCRHSRTDKKGLRGGYLVRAVV